jgi:uncharacterized protein (TIGR00369 family)
MLPPVKKRIANPYIDQQCFFCGEKNDAGLRLVFFLDEDAGEVSTEYTASEPFVGLGSILHGGIQSGLIDEIMGWTALMITGEQGVTLELTVKFIKPVYLGEKLLVTCRVSERTDPRVHLEARIESPTGVLRTSASGIYHLLPPDRFEQVVHRPLAVDS